MAVETQGTWTRAARSAAPAALAAGALSTVALAARGRLEAGSAAAPANATRQWLWGDEAARTTARA